MLSDFLTEVIAVHQAGDATEHSYRPALKKLFDNIHTKVTAQNEPKREKVGAPDFVFRRGDIVIGHCEAKDLHVDLKKMKGTNAAQKKRYVDGLSNLIYTNCLEWIFYREGEIVSEIKIADFDGGIQPIPRKFNALEQMLRDFTLEKPQTIKSPRRLAERMAGKAILIKDVLANTLEDEDAEKTDLYAQYQAFKDNLIDDISIGEFADLYAETIAYGMFAARLHDPTPQDFSRQEALELLPKTNPFLRSLFSYIAGPDLDERISWVIDDLAEIFQACNVADLMSKYGSTTQRNDPFLHFYETFLAAYNPKKRKARGVWYTPEPVVNFIVRAVDDVLKKEFGLSEGLADTSKVTVDWDLGAAGPAIKGGKKTKSNFEKRDVHRVQILDPATGTGTFLAEAIKQIAPRVKAAGSGAWSFYVEKDLIPRLHGFELLMASYAMCHMKLDMVLTELGYKPSANPPRLSVYLTNSLEEGQPDQRDLLMARWLSNEARGANEVKRDQPIMCVIGNPPYSGISQNMGEWIVSLIEDYKYVDGEHFGERKHWLHDDYVKFIRFSEHMIEKNGEGVLGFVTNHGYLDNPTFRGMRWHLLTTFDKIYVMDLHGNAKKKEVSPDGSPDKNVFDIQQGVAIIVAVKKKSSKKKKSGSPLAEVYHSEIWGERQEKYESLRNASLLKSDWNRLDLRGPRYPFAERNWELRENYENGFSIDELMTANVSGIVTMGDGFIVQEKRRSIGENIRLLLGTEITEAELKTKFSLGKNYAKWLIENRSSIRFDESKIVPFCYRPFDTRWTYFDNKLIWRWRVDVMRQFLRTPQLAFAIPKITRDGLGGLAVKNMAGHKIYSAYDTNNIFPLYLYPDENAHKDEQRRVNFDQKLYAKLRKLAGKRPLSPASEAEKAHGENYGGAGLTGAAPGKEANEFDVFDYIYGVLHCPAYRETYAEFLKIDFPRIPWPKSPEVFWSVREKGEALRRLHLMEDAAIGETPYPFETEPGEDGDNTVDQPTFEKGRVYINRTQYFDTVPEISWGFYIGGYQPAQKWLKDRKGRELSFEDIRHYQKIIKILSETDRIMNTIEMPL